MTAEIARAAEGLGYALADPGERSPHIIGVRLRSDAHGTALRDSLAARNVQVSVRGDAVRISPNVYKDLDDVAALVGAVEEGSG